MLLKTVLWLTKNEENYIREFEMKWIERWNSSWTIDVRESAQMIKICEMNKKICVKTMKLNVSYKNIFVYSIMISAHSFLFSVLDCSYFMFYSVYWIMFAQFCITNTFTFLGCNRFARYYHWTRTYWYYCVELFDFEKHSH